MQMKLYIPNEIVCEVNVYSITHHSTHYMKSNLFRMRIHIEIEFISYDYPPKKFASLLKANLNERIWVSFGRMDEMRRYYIEGFDINENEEVEKLFLRMKL